MQLHRVVLAWSGPSVVGSAVTVLHYDGSNQSAPPVGAILTAFNQQRTLFAPGTTITVPSTGDSINDTDGSLMGVWANAGGGQMTGNGSSTNSAAGVGACIGWSTGGIVKGRKLRGRTFIVPLHVGCYEANGTIEAGALTGLNALAAALQASGPLAVWHRPTTKGGTDGTSYGVLSNRVRDKVAVLRSRRD